MASPSPPSRTVVGVLARWLAPALLCTVALVQLTLAHTQQLSPWKGGGFGMFASNDQMERRPLHITLEAECGEYIVDPFAVGLPVRRLTRVAVMPDARVLDRLARHVAAQPWQAGPSPPADGLPRARPAAADSPAALDVHRVRVEIRRLRFHPDTGRVEVERMAEAEHALHAEVPAP